MAVETSLGAGIALQGETNPEFYAGIAQKNKEEGLRRRQLLDQKKKENDAKQNKSFNDYLQSIEVKGIHPIYEEKLSNETNDLLNLMQETKNDPNNFNRNWTNDPKIKKKLNDLKFSYQDAKHAGDQLDKDFNELRTAKPDQYDVDPEILDAVKQNDYEKFTTVLKEKGYAQSDLYSGGLIKPKEIPFDLYKPLKELDPTVLSSGYSKKTPQGGVSSEVTKVDEGATDETVQNFLKNNPDYVKKGFKGDMNAAYDFVSNQIKSKAKTSTKYSEEDKGNKTKYGKGGASNNKYSFTHGFLAAEGPDGEQGNEIVFEDVKGNDVPKFGATVDGESVMVEKPSLYTGDDPKSPDAKWMVSGTVKKQVPVLDKKGVQETKEVKDNGKTQHIPQFKTEEVQVRVPFDQVAPEMKAKFDFDLNEYVSQADFGDQKKQTKKQENKKSDKKEYSKAELTKKAEAAGYSFDEYYDLVKDKVTLK